MLLHILMLMQGIINYTKIKFKCFYLKWNHNSYYRDAGKGDLKVNLIHDETKTEVPVRIIDNEDNTYQVEVIPPHTGSYTTNLMYGGLKVPVAPKVFVNPNVDVSKIKVDGLEPSKFKFIYFIFYTNTQSQISKIKKI